MDQTLGHVIRKRRKELGLTQEELALRVADGVSQADISRLENDRVELPRRSRMEQLARALEVPLGSLLIHSAWNDAPDDALEPGDAGQKPPVDTDLPELAETVSQMHELIHHAESIIEAATPDDEAPTTPTGPRTVHTGTSGS